MNWGKGLTIVITVFLFAILMMVFTVSNDRIDLVTEDYYPREIIYQQNIEKQKNYQNLAEKPDISLNRKHLVIFFPNSLISDSLTGSLMLYRPSDKFLDRKYIIDFKEKNTQHIDVSDLKPGKYESILEWTSNDKGYFVKKIIVL